MHIVDDLKYKSQCYYEKKTFLSVIRVFFTDGTSAMILYRIVQFLQSLKLGIFGFFFIFLNKFLNGCVIGRNVNFKEGFVIMHPVGVVINGQVQGGKNLVIESGVVIGAARNGLPIEVPRLGDNIFIGSGAKIIGGIKIGNNVKIGANAVVVDDVEDNQTVVGVPARPRRRAHDAN